MAAFLFHIIDASTWNDVRHDTHYAPDSLTSEGSPAGEGFIHLSLRDQILRPANLLYHGRTDLHLLVIDAAKLEAEVVMEPGSHGEAALFPHLYGALNLDAVDRVVEFPCRDDGTFVLPVEL